MTRMGTIMNMECEFEIYRGDGVDRIYCISAIRIPPPFPALAPEMSSLFFGLRVHCVHWESFSVPESTGNPLRGVSVFVVLLLSHVRQFVTPWTGACQAPLSFTVFWSLLKLSNHLILYCPYLLLPNLSQHQGLLQWVNCSYLMAKVLELQLQHQSFQWIFRADLL